MTNTSCSDRHATVTISTKQIDVSFLCVCPLIDDKLRHNIVEVLRSICLTDNSFIGGAGWGEWLLHALMVLHTTQPLPP